MPVHNSIHKNIPHWNIIIPGCRSDTGLVRGSRQIGQWPPDSGDRPIMTPQWVLPSSMELDVGGTEEINTPPELLGVARS